MLRVPNQLCVALNQPEGWYSVIGTLVGAASFAYLGYDTYIHEQTTKKSQ